MGMPCPHHREALKELAQLLKKGGWNTLPSPHDTPLSENFNRHRRNLQYFDAPCRDQLSTFEELAYTLREILPLAATVESSAFTDAERDELHQLAGQGCVFYLSNFVARLHMLDTSQNPLRVHEISTGGLREAVAHTRMLQTLARRIRKAGALAAHAVHVLDAEARRRLLSFLNENEVHDLALLLARLCSKAARTLSRTGKLPRHLRT